MEQVIVNTDGGSRGNPGPAAIAAVLHDSEGEVVGEHAELIGDATNNVAEYRALLLGIERAAELDPAKLELRCDSELVVRQVLGEYKVKKGDLKPLHAKATSALRAFDSWTIKHVRREQNERADALVNEALDAG